MVRALLWLLTSYSNGDGLDNDLEITKQNRLLDILNVRKNGGKGDGQEVKNGIVFF